MLLVDRLLDRPPVDRSYWGFRRYPPETDAPSSSYLWSFGLGACGWEFFTTSRGLGLLYIGLPFSWRSMKLYYPSATRYDYVPEHLRGHYLFAINESRSSE